MNDDLKNYSSIDEDGIEFIDIPPKTEDIILEPVEPDCPAPQKAGSQKYNIVRLCILAVSVAVFIYAAFNLFKIFSNYKKGDKEYEQVKEEVFSPPKENETPPKVLVGSDSYTEVVEEDDEYKFLSYDHAALKAINKDAQGYLDIPAIDLSVPIALCDNNSYYLDHAITKSYHSYGCPFIDYRIKDGLKARNPIIYGHSMKNGAMFGMLNRYLKVDFYKTKGNNYIYLYCEEGIYIYEIFSVYITDSHDTGTYTFEYADDAAYADYVARVKSRSYYNTGVQASGEDNILTLSTCYDEDRQRLILHAKRLK